MPAAKGITVSVHIAGARETLMAFRDLPKDADAELRTASQRIAETMVTQIRRSATAEGRQAAALAKTVKARRDRLPAVQAGGVTRIGRKRKPAYKLLFGSEFGSNRLPQFKPHVGRGSYWFFATVESEQDRMAREWRAAADRILAAFTRGGES